MRVLFTTWAWGSHFNPMVPLGWALRAAGHEVIVVSHPGFAPTIARAGLSALPAGGPVDLAAELSDAIRRSTWKPGVHNAGTVHDPIKQRRGLTVLRMAAASADAMADDTLRFTQTWRPDCVVFEPTAFLGPVLAGALGVPSYRLLWTVDFSASITVVEDELLGGLAARLGAPRVNALGDGTLDPCPPRLQTEYGNARQPMRYVPYNGPATVPMWLRAHPRRPRICVTWGTSLQGMGMQDRVLAARVAAALATRNVEVVLAVTEEQSKALGPLPANVIHAGRVPLHLLLPSCTAVVHQGGGGTLMTAMDAGVPQFILPFVPDTVLNAHQVAGTGAGMQLWSGDLSDSDLNAALAGFLDDLEPYRAGAARLRAEHLDQPTPLETVRELERQACGAGKDRRATGPGDRF
jgi:UDP:flavonoid glycosyltransferase YjiC (YdhE family)